MSSSELTLMHQHVLGVAEQTRVYESRLNDLEKSIAEEESDLEEEEEIRRNYVESMRSQSKRQEDLCSRRANAETEVQAVQDTLNSMVSREEELQEVASRRAVFTDKLAALESSVEHAVQRASEELGMRERLRAEVQRGTDERKAKEADIGEKLRALDFLRGELAEAKAVQVRLEEQRVSITTQSEAKRQVQKQRQEQKKKLESSVEETREDRASTVQEIEKARDEFQSRLSSTGKEEQTIQQDLKAVRDTSEDCKAKGALKKEVVDGLNRQVPEMKHDLKSRQTEADNVSATATKLQERVEARSSELQRHREGVAIGVQSYEDAIKVNDTEAEKNMKCVEELEPAIHKSQRETRPALEAKRKRIEEEQDECAEVQGQKERLQAAIKAEQDAGDAMKAQQSESTATRAAITQTKAELVQAREPPADGPSLPEALREVERQLKEVAEKEGEDGRAEEALKEEEAEVQAVKVKEQEKQKAKTDAAARLKEANFGEDEKTQIGSRIQQLQDQQTQAVTDQIAKLVKERTAARSVEYERERFALRDHLQLMEQQEERSLVAEHDKTEAMTKARLDELGVAINEVEAQLGPVLKEMQALRQQVEQGPTKPPTGSSSSSTGSNSGSQ